ncbi:urease accessory protein UreD [Nocardioides sp. SOB77]|uniref:Urease accessory protein UreD n=1 Tax=Nocardioides oceani TaxID=3058369 RepID=A0ABT8FER2_9ACTN|nr:urease accessory protein UreD [Nocardioides oceani]MDN4173152.1 urease accessory protein UreD [Nocardioides oceani]
MTTCMTTSTPDRAAASRDGASRTRVLVERPPGGGRLRVRTAATGGTSRPLLRAVLLSADERTARVALVPEGALLLAGDEVAVEVEVGAGATLELLEPAGTVAYDMRGASARWDVDLRIGAGGSVVWHGEPFVAAAGSRVHRATRVVLGDGARLALREQLVLGRYAEWPGTIEQELVATTAAGDPLLVEHLALGPDTVGMALGGRRVLASVLCLGADDGGPAAPERLELEGGGTLVRATADEAHLATTADAWARAARAVRAVRT